MPDLVKTEPEKTGSNITHIVKKTTSYITFY
jgi:hypothetical protein